MTASWSSTSAATLAAETLQACALLRAAGFKIVLHWMPNLLGATPESDRADFARLWDGWVLPRTRSRSTPASCWPTPSCTSTGSAANTSPTPQEELVDLIADIKPTIPRLLPGQPRDPRHPLDQRGAGQQAHQPAPGCPGRAGPPRAALPLHPLPGGARPAGGPGRAAPGRPHLLPAPAEEHFLPFVTPDDQLAGYLRLSLPGSDAPPGRRPAA